MQGIMVQCSKILVLYKIFKKIMKICTGLISVCLYNYKLCTLSFLFSYSSFRSEMEYLPLKINAFRYEYIP